MTKQCSICGEEFNAKQKTQKYCSTKCAYKAMDEKRQAHKDLKDPQLPKLEIYAHYYKGIEVCVKIDYSLEEVSLMDNRNINSAKQWVFQKRTVEYMNGWLLILEAMSDAVRVAKQKLLDYQKMRESLSEKK